MGLFSWFSKFTSPSAPTPRPQVDEKPKPGERKLAAILPSYSYTSGWLDDRTKQVRHYTYWLYVGVSVICETIAGMGTPNVGWVGSTARGRKSGSARNRVWRKAMGAIKPHEELEHVPLNHPIMRLFDRPNSYDENYDLWYELFLFKKLTGSTYLWTSARNGLGNPAELWVMPSHWVFPRGSKDKLVDHYEVRPYGGSAGMMKLDPADLVQLKSKNPLSKIDGFSALSAGAKWIDTGESVDSARWGQMKNQMRPELVLKMRQEADPDDDELERFYKKFAQRFGGELNTGVPMIVSGAIEEAIPLQYPAEIFYIQTADQMRDFVLCGLLRVPKEVIGIQPSGSDLSWYAPLRQFCSGAINPELKYAGQVLTRFAQQWDENLRVWWDDCTPDNPDQVNKDIAQDFAVGAITPNEVRALRGRDDYANGGDDPLIPQTLTPFPMNSGEDLSGFADLMPGGQEQQPEQAVDEFGNPMPTEPPAAPPGVPQEKPAPSNPVEATTAGMNRVAAILAQTNGDGMAAASSIFAAGVERMRNPKKSIKPKADDSPDTDLRSALRKAIQDDSWTSPKPSTNGFHSTATK